MIRTFVRHGSAYLISSFVARAVNFLTLPIYARTLLPEDLGVYELITVFSGIAGVFIALEITQGVARYFHESPDQKVQQGYVSSAFWFTTITYSIFILICILAAEPIAAWLLDNPVHADTFRLGMLACLSGGISYFTLNQLRWQLKAPQYAIAAITQTVVSQSLALVLVLVWNYGAEGLFLGAFLGGCIGGGLALYFARSHYKLEMDWKKIREMIYFSVPLAVSGLAVLAITQMDRIIIKEMLGVAEVGLYGVTARFAGVAAILLIGFQSTLTPLVTSARSEAATPGHVAAIFRYFVASALPIVLGLAVFSREFMELMAGANYVQAHTIVPLLAIGTLLSGMYVFAPGLWLAKQTLTTLVINVTVALLNAGMAVLLVSRMGIAGAALAFATGAAIHFFLTYRVGQRHFPIPIEWGKVGFAVVPVVVLSYLGVLEENSWRIKTVLVVAGSIFIWSLLIKLSEIKRTFALLR